MRRLALVVVVVVCAGGTHAASVTAGGSGEQRCRTVVKKVHGKPKRVRVCPKPKPKPKKPRPTPTPPGIRVDVGGYRLYLECTGTGSPTVVFDSGLGGDHTAWAGVQPDVAAFTRTCTYDRAGLGLSDARPASLPATTEQVAAELDALIRSAPIAPPFVLVGHSIGGLDIRYHDSAHGGAAGLVFVDSSLEERLTAPIGGGEPIDPSSAARSLAAAHPTFGARPVVVIERRHDFDTSWHDGQVELAARSTNSILVEAKRSDHLIPLRQPLVVVAAVRVVVDAVRSSSHLAACSATFPALGGTCELG